MSFNCLEWVALSLVFGTPPPPNFVVLFVDDWGWGDLGANCLHMGDVPGAQPDALDKEVACHGTLFLHIWCFSSS